MMYGVIQYVILANVLYLDFFYSCKMLVVFLAHLKSRWISDIVTLYLEIILGKMFLSGGVRAFV